MFKTLTLKYLQTYKRTKKNRLNSDAIHFFLELVFLLESMFFFINFCTIKICENKYCRQSNSENKNQSIPHQKRDSISMCSLWCNVWCDICHFRLGKSWEYSDFCFRNWIACSTCFRIFLWCKN